MFLTVPVAAVGCIAAGSIDAVIQHISEEGAASRCGNRA